jgi:hypothetical protein
VEPDLLAAILAQGGLGLVAAVTTSLFLHERREYKAYREKADVDLRALADAKAAAERLLLEKINDIREEGAKRELAALQTVEYFAKAQVESVEELGRIASALRKAYERLRR